MSLWCLAMVYASNSICRFMQPMIRGDTGLSYRTWVRAWCKATLVGNSIPYYIEEMGRVALPKTHIVYGFPSENIKYGLRLARSSIVSAKTPLAQANQLPVHQVSKRQSIFR